MTKQAVIIGVGASKGLGAALARRFSKGGLSVILAGRTEAKLQAIEEEIVNVGGQAASVVCDVTDEASVNSLFASVAETGTLDAVLFNAGNNAIIPFADLDAETFEAFWRVGCMGGFLTAKAAAPIMLEQGHGSLLFTGASGSMRGKPSFAHFAAAKAGLRMLSQSLAREYGSKGIHVAHVIVDGVIDGDMVGSRFAEYLDALGPDGGLNPDDMAEAFWMLHSQPRSTWTQELDLRPYSENW